MSEKKCDCHAYMAGECVCGAWDDNDLLAANKEIERLKSVLQHIAIKCVGYGCNTTVDLLILVDTIKQIAESEEALGSFCKTEAKDGE